MSFDLNERRTIFSPCKQYRYTLWRDWTPVFADNVSRFVNFICLNPSTATATTDDNTMRKCIKFSKAWGFDAMCVTNIFAYRSTDPVKLLNLQDPTGPENDMYIRHIAGLADMVVAAWSQHAVFMERSTAVRKLLREIDKPVHYLKMGQHEPCHPLYLPDSTKPELWVTM